MKNANGHLNDAINFTKNEIVKTYVALKNQPQFKNFPKQVLLGIALSSIVSAECEKVKIQEIQVVENEQALDFPNEVNIEDDLERRMEYYARNYNPDPENLDLAPLYLYTIAIILGMNFGSYETHQDLCQYMYKNVINKLVGENTDIDGVRQQYNYNVNETMPFQLFLNKYKNEEEAKREYEEYLIQKKRTNELFKKASPPFPSPNNKRRKF